MHPARAHMRSYIEAIGSASDASLSRESDCLWARTGLGWPMFNGGIGGDEDTVLRALDDLDVESGPSFFWWGTHDDSPQLGELLEGRGMTPFDVAAPWMQAEIADLPPAEIPTGGEVVEVKDPATAREWCDTLVKGFDFPDVGGERWYEATERFGIGDGPWRMWVARHDGEPAGVTMGFNGGGIAGLFGMAVVPKMRRLGYGAFLTLLPLHTAAESGETVAGFFSTESGLPLYRALGFKPDGSMSRWLGGRNPFA